MRKRMTWGKHPCQWEAYQPLVTMAKHTNCQCSPGLLGRSRCKQEVSGGKERKKKGEKNTDENVRHLKNLELQNTKQS